MRPSAGAHLGGGSCIHYSTCHFHTLMLFSLPDGRASTSELLYLCFRSQSETWHFATTHSIIRLRATGTTTAAHLFLLDYKVPFQNQYLEERAREEIPLEMPFLSRLLIYCQDDFCSSRRKTGSHSQRKSWTYSELVALSGKIRNKTYAATHYHWHTFPSRNNFDDPPVSPSTSSKFNQWNGGPNQPGGACDKSWPADDPPTLWSLLFFSLSLPEMLSPPTLLQRRNLLLHHCDRRNNGIYRARPLYNLYFLSLSLNTHRLTWIITEKRLYIN